MRRHGVVGKFVEFYGPGVAETTLADRVTIANMSPEFGSTCAYFPIDDETLRYLRFTGRRDERVDAGRGLRQGTGPVARARTDAARYTEHVELDLATVVPSLAGPRRPQDRVPLDRRAAAFRAALPDILGLGPDRRRRRVLGRRGVRGVVPGQRPTGDRHRRPRPGPLTEPAPQPRPGRPASAERRSTVTLDGAEHVIDHGTVAIAAITSCTNTSNPAVMVAAGAAGQERGRSAACASKPWVKTSLSPGSRVVTDYFDDAGLTPYLEKLGFHLAGYGCMTCIGASGPLIDEVTAAVHEHDLTVVVGAVGQPQLRRPDQPRRPDELPRLAAAGGRLRPRRHHGHRPGPRPARHRPDGQPGATCATSGPTSREIQDVIDATARRRRCSPAPTPTCSPATTGGAPWTRPTGETFAWDDDSTYLRRPPYLDGMTARARPRCATSSGARVLVKLGDSVTTDHVSPAGAIPPHTPAGQLPDRARRRAVPAQHLRLPPRQPRGDDARLLRQRAAAQPARPRRRGRVHPQLPHRRGQSVYDAAMAYRAADVPLVVIGGQGVRQRVVARLGRQGPRPARRPRRPRRVVRADPPLEPGRHGHPAPAVPPRGTAPSRSA